MKADFNKSPDGLLPAIVQDASTQKVLMLGYMNADALEQTQKTKKVTFFSRSKKRLWTKGEESGNFLNLVDIQARCDLDTFDSGRSSRTYLSQGSIPAGMTTTALPIGFYLV